MKILSLLSCTVGVPHSHISFLMPSKLIYTSDIVSFKMWLAMHVYMWQHCLMVTLYCEVSSLKADSSFNRQGSSHTVINESYGCHFYCLINVNLSWQPIVCDHCMLIVL